MNDGNLDAFLEKLQQNILDEAHQAYGAKGFELWLNPRHRRVMNDADGRASLTGDCGDTIDIFVKMDPSSCTVSQASYQTNGCASSSICGSLAAELAVGRSAEDILDMNGATILDQLEKFPRAEEHCAHLAIMTLKEAINDVMRRMVAEKRRE